MYVAKTGRLYFQDSEGLFYPITKKDEKLIVSSTSTNMVEGFDRVFEALELKRKTHAMEIVFEEDESVAEEEKVVAETSDADEEVAESDEAELEASEEKPKRSVGRPATKAKKDGK